MKRRMLFSCFAALAIVLVMKYVAGLPMTEENFEWYYNLRLPSKLIPTNKIFAIVWAVIYALLATSLTNLFVSCSATKLRSFGIIFALHSILHVGWGVLFFGLHNPVSGFYCILALTMSLLAVIWQTKKLSYFSAALLLPYLGWISFATFVSWKIMILNPF